jgi:excisionase family DNA binding protein
MTGVICPASIRPSSVRSGLHDPTAGERYDLQVEDAPVRPPQLWKCRVVPRDVSTTAQPDLSRLLADAAAIVAAASGDNRAAARAGFLVWMDSQEAAAYLNYPLGAFKALAGRGELPRHKRGAAYRYKREELDQWLLLG